MLEFEFMGRLIFNNEDGNPVILPNPIDTDLIGITRYRSLRLAFGATTARSGDDDII